MKRTLNIRFLVCLLGVGAAIGLSGHFLRAFQVKRNAGAIRDKAIREAEAGRHPAAIKEYSRYLALVPDDAEAWAEKGLLLDKTAKTPGDKMNVFFALDRSLRLKGDRTDVRRRLVQIAIDIGRFTDAEQHILVLRQSFPDDAQLRHQLGRCLEAGGEYAKAADNYESAKKQDKTLIESYVRLADVWRRRLNKPAMQTDKLMKEMVEANESAQAYMARARYLRQRALSRDGDEELVTPTLLGTELTLLAADLVSSLTTHGPGLGYSAARVAFTGGPARVILTGVVRDQLFVQAEQDLVKARGKAPDDAEVLLESSELERIRGWGELALAYAVRGLEVHPKDVRMYQQVANLNIVAGRRSEAISCLRLGVKALPNEPDLPFLLADQLIQAGQLEEASAIVAVLKKQRIDPAILDYLDGRGKVGEEKWLEASIALEQAYPGLVRWPELARQTALLLGKCYEQLGDADQQYGAYRRVHTEDTRDPLWFTVSEGEARALLGLNKVEEALDAYRKLTLRVPGARIIVARLLIARNLGLPESRRRWDEVDQILNETERLFPKSSEVKILRVQALAARLRYQEAQDLLMKADQEQPADTQIWVARAGLAALRGKASDALSILDEAEKEFGDHIELRLARVRFNLQSEDKDAGKQVRKLEDGIDHFSKPEQFRLLRGLADAYTLLEMPGEARRLLDRIARQKPNDLGVRINLFDLALRAKDDGESERLLNEIRRLEGEKGTLWRYGAAARIIYQARDKNALADARTLLIAVAARRPAWCRVPVGEAEIEEKSGNPEAAVQYYLRAIELGERSPSVLLKTIAMLRERGRYDDAYQVIQNLPEHSPLLRDMNQVIIDLSLKARDTTAAMNLARKAVADNPKDYRNQLSLAQACLALDRRTEAEECLRRSVELADNVADTWMMLILYLARTDRQKEAEALIGKAQGKLPLEKYRLGYAQCYEAVGQLDRAKELYEAALAASASDPAALRAAAEFALRTGKPDEAKNHLTRLIGLRQKSPIEAASARRLLGMVLVAKGSNYQETREALAALGLLDQAPDSTTESAYDKRARALILAAQRRRRDREEAIRTLEDIGKLQPLTVQDQFLLAQLYYSLNQWNKTHSLMLSVLSRNEGQNPFYLAYFAGLLLDRNEPGEAQPLVASLEKAQPAEFRTVEVKARLLHAQNRVTEAVALLTKFAEGKDAPLLPIAMRLERMGQTAAAEKMYVKLRSESKKPETALILAGFLGRNGRLSAALDLCESARSTCPPEMVASDTVTILYGANPGEADQKRGERLLQECLRSAGDKARSRNIVEQNIGALYNLQGRFDESEAIYRRCLEQDKRNVLAMNNLAWLFATKERNATEALSLIQAAINTAGPLPSLLDTRAIVHLAMGNSELAVTDLEEVVLEKPTGSGYFHLAQAQYAGKNKAAAHDALRRAVGMGLKARDLHPFERDKYEQLLTALNLK